ncbi:MAG: OsmC family protein [Gemmatimonadaceae bacterium]
MTEVKTKPPARIVATWAGDERFDSGLPGRETFRTDGRRETGPSPVDALLCALASCSGIDVAEILAKRRTPVEALSIEVIGDRAAAVPPRVTSVLMKFRIRGAGIERPHAERAIELAVTKYCSVRDTLDPDMPVSWTLDLEG